MCLWISPEIVGPNVFSCSEPIQIKYLRYRWCGSVWTVFRRTVSDADGHGHSPVGILVSETDMSATKVAFNVGKRT